MRFLMLLLPNIYDIFTILAICYAYFVDKETPLKIPFLFACVVIYIATRLGIFAGQIIGMLSGQVGEEPEDVNDADAFAKRVIWGFVPQLIGVIVFQVIMAFCYLPNFPGLADKQQNQTQNVQLYNNNDKSDVVADQQEAPVVEEAQVPESAELEVKTDANNDTEETAVPVAAKEEKQPVRTSSYVYRRNTSVSAKAPAKTTTQQELVQNPVSANTVRYSIPERTLQIAGVDKVEVNLNNVKPSPTVYSQTTSTGNWSFSASTPVNAQNVTQQSATANAGSATQPKRYPGDDNPINTSWGYYRTGKWAADAARTLSDK